MIRTLEENLMKFPVSTSLNFGQTHFFLLLLWCLPSCCAYMHAFLYSILVSYNGASNSCVYVVEKFAVRAFIVNTAFFFFYSSFVIFWNCIPMIKITPLFFVLCSFFYWSFVHFLTSSWLESLKYKWLRLSFCLFLIQYQVRECNRVCDYYQ